MDGIILVVNGAHGIYVPQAFAERFSDHIEDKEDLAILLAGPDHEYYDDAWCDVLDETVIDGYHFTQHDGDVFAYDRSKMTAEEQINFFGEYDPPEGTTVYMVGEHFACAIEYGDMSGLEGNEEELLNEFFDRETPDNKHHWTIETALSDEFGECEITGLRGKLVGLLLVDMSHLETA